MQTVILNGTKQEIVDQLASLDGNVTKAIVYVESTVAASKASPTSLPEVGVDEDIFAEMAPYMVEVGYFDDSREAIYTRLEGE